MSDPFGSFIVTLSDPGGKHTLLVADPEANISPRPRAIFCQEAGEITIRDEDGADLPYSLAQGSSIPFRGVRVVSISGGVFYGWS